MANENQTALGMLIAAIAAYCATLTANASKISFVSDQVFGFQMMRTYARIYFETDPGQRSIHAFVDLRTGDVVSAKSWNQPNPRANWGSVFLQHAPDGDQVAQRAAQRAFAEASLVESFPSRQTLPTYC